MKKVKKYYLLILLIIALSGVAIYGTYAMFDQEIRDNLINLQTSTAPVDQEIMEYQRIVLDAKEDKTISLNVSNSTNQTLHYGAWYQMISPSTIINDNITIAKLTDSPNETSGTIDGNSNKTIYIYVGNNSSSTIILYVGIKYSETSSLNLSNNRELITDTRDGKYVVGVTVTNGTVENGKTITNMLEDGNFENKGWSNCTYSTEHVKYGAYACRLDATSSDSEKTTVHNEALTLNNSHHYYARVEGYSIGLTWGQEFQAYFPIAEPPLGTVELDLKGIWNLYSVINNRTSFENGSNYQLRFDYNNNKNSGTIYYDGGMLLDLSQDFGSSYPSKEILDRSIGYFDGSVSYNYVKLNKGNSTSFKVTPASGYKFESVSCTNSNANYNESNDTLTINNITGDVQCNVKFSLLRTSNEMLAYLGLSAKSGIPDFSQIATTDEGIYAAQDDYGTSYYFRGAVTNNYVKFAGYYWRIIRINGDGTLRLIYDGTVAHANGEKSDDRHIGVCEYNSVEYNNTRVGYMFGRRSTSYEETHANINNSTIKTTVDNWYKTNIQEAGYSDKVADVIYCNDRQTDTMSGYGNGLGYGQNETRYMPSYRLYVNKNPVLTCSQQNDRFTVEDTIKGNGALTYPVGLITADEMAMAGVVEDEVNDSYYLYIGDVFWTMSPGSFGSRAFVYTSYRGLFGSGVSADVNVARPVLSLRSDISVTGSGIQNNPWVVQN